MITLDELAQRYGTDKSSLHHNYVEVYDQYLAQRRQDPITVLELGIGGHEDPTIGGASLRMWADYFPQATIIGLDVEEKHLDFGRQRVHIYKGSQDDQGLLEAIAAEHGSFDVVIDDASHVSSLTVAAFKAAYPLIKPSGLYWCEDTHMAYHDFYYGRDEANENPDGLVQGAIANGMLPSKPTAMQFFRRMADEVNFHGNHDTDLYPEKYWLGYSLEWAHFYYNLLVLKKAWWAPCAC